MFRLVGVRCSELKRTHPLLHRYKPLQRLLPAVEPAAPQPLPALLPAQQSAVSSQQSASWLYTLLTADSPLYTGLLRPLYNRLAQDRTADLRGCSGERPADRSQSATVERTPDEGITHSALKQVFTHGGLYTFHWIGHGPHGQYKRLGLVQNLSHQTFYGEKGHIPQNLVF